MNLYLRRGLHPQATDNFRVILKHSDGPNTRSAALACSMVLPGAVFWAWGIDTVVPMRDVGAQGRGRDDELRRRGVGRPLALKTANDQRGPWRLANSPAVTMAPSNTFFAVFGLPSLTARTA